MEHKLNQVLQWATLITAEADGYQALTRYYWTAPVEKALFRLKTYDSYFIGLVGSVGSGKTSAIHVIKDRLTFDVREENERRAKSMIEEEMAKHEASPTDIPPPSEEEKRRIWQECHREVISVKWKDDLWDLVSDHIRQGACYDHYLDEIYENIMELPKVRNIIERIKSEQIYRLSEKQILSRLKFEVDAEAILPSRILNQIRLKTVKNWLSEHVDTLLIDMPDYSQKGSWKINKDLDGITALWNMVREEYSDINILVCLQRELVINQPHLILGKMDKIFLNPLTPEQLLEAFMQFFGSYEPFTEEGLRLVAKLSRGIFRRFKNYIRLCLEDHIEEERKGLISPEAVKNSITKEQLRADMDLELTEIFKSTEKKDQAFNIVQFLNENPNVSQKTLAEKLGIHPSLLGKLIDKLESHGYVESERGKGKELLMRIKL